MKKCFEDRCAPDLISTQKYIGTCTCARDCVFVHKVKVHIDVKGNNESNNLLHIFSTELIRKKIHTFQLYRDKDPPRTKTKNLINCISCKTQL